MSFRKIAFFLFAFIFTLSASCIDAISMALATDKPNPIIDYVDKLNETVEANRPARLNAAPYYDKAIRLYAETSYKKFREPKCWPLELKPDELDILRKWVQANSKALIQLHNGSRMPYYWSKYKGESIWSIELPLVKKALNLANLLTWSAKLKASEGKVEEAVTDIVTCYRFGLHISKSLLLIEQLTGMRTTSEALEAAFCILDSGQFDTEAITYLQREIEQLFSEQTYLFDLQSEKLNGLDIIQKIFTDDGKGDGQMHLASAQSMLSMIKGSAVTQEEIQDLFELRRRKTAEAMQKAYEYFDVVLRKSPWEWKKEKININVELDKLTESNPLVKLVVPNIPLLLKVSAHYRAEKDALIVSLALLRYKADKGQFPITLQSLVSTGYLANLPMDPYSDKPLVYKRVKDNFVLYSIGIDFDDDGGTPVKLDEDKLNGDKVFWPVQTQLLEANSSID